MFATYTKAQKSVFKQLVNRGEDLYCAGDGWHFNDIVFTSFKEFYQFCKDQLDK